MGCRPATYLVLLDGDAANVPLTGEFLAADGKFFGSASLRTFLPLSRYMPPGNNQDQAQRITLESSFAATKESLSYSVLETCQEMLSPKQVHF